MKKILLAAFAVFAFAFSANASHMVGGSMAYEYLGYVGDVGGVPYYRYVIELTVYNNCDPSSAVPLPVPDHPYSIYVHDVSGAPMGGVDKIKYYDGTAVLVDSTEIVPPLPSGCAVGSSTCIYKGVYRDTVDLPYDFISGDGLNGFHLVFEEFARNAAIVNLFDPGGTGMSFHCYIPPPLVANSSPYFTDDPVPFICINDTTSLLNTAIDPDGDMLIFSFVDPYDGGFGPPPDPLPWPIGPVTWDPGLPASLPNPFGPSGYAYIDAATGLTQYMIPATGNYVVAVEVQEWRGGQLIGITRRDLQLLAIVCPPNDAPVIDPSSTAYVNDTIIEGDNLCFPIEFNDINGDSLTLTVTGQIFDPLFTNPTATVTSPVVGDSTVSTTFCWDTDCGQAQPLPYLFTAQVTDNGCPPKTENIVYSILVIPSDPPDTLIGPQLVCEGETVTYYAEPDSVGYTYDWVAIGGTVTSGQGTDSVQVTWGSPGAANIYVTWTGALGCASDSIDLDVTVVATPLADAGMDTTICFGDTVQIGGSPTGPIGANISWTPIDSISDPTATNPFVWPSTTTSYYLETDQGLTCLGYDTVTITVSNPNPDADPNVQICLGDSTQLIATGGTSCVWTPIPDLSDPNICDPWASPTDTTIYFVTITDTLGCIATDSVVVTVNPIPIVTVSNDTTICLNDCVQLTATGGSAYSWSPPSGLDDPNIFNPLACPLVTTTYTVTVTDTNGCVDSAQVTITVNGLPVADAGLDVEICVGDSVQLTGSGGITCAWSPTADLDDPNSCNPWASPTITTEYILTVTDANGCTDVDSIIVTVNALPTADAGMDVDICIGDSTQLMANGGITCAWMPTTDLDDPNSCTPWASPSTTTTYTVTVTDANSCVDTDDVTVTVNPLPAITISNDTTICENDCAQLVATGGTNYSWTPTTGLSNPGISNPLACPTITTLYTVMVTDGNGCVDSASVTVTVLPAPVADAGPDETICAGDSVQLNGSGGISCAWMPTTGLDDPNSCTPWASPVSTTTYTLTVTDGNGCTATDDVEVTVNSLPPADAGADVSICIGDSTQLIASGGVSCTWSPTTNLSDPNICDPFASPTVTTTYTVTVTDGNGCQDTSSVTVTVNPLPAITISNDTTICEGDCAPLFATGGITYSWSPATGLDDPNSATPLGCPTTTTTYTATVTDANGCIDSASVTITVNPLPIADAGVDETICIGDSVQLNGTGGISCSWTPTTDLDDPNSCTPWASPIITTDYILTVVDINGCSQTDTMTVNVNPLPTITISNDTTICEGDCAPLFATGGLTYSWSPSTGLDDPNSATPTACPTATTLYTVTVTDANGCVDSASVTITVNPAPVADAGLDVDICIGDTIQFSASGGVSCTWIPVTNLSNWSICDPFAWPGATTTYTVVVTDANGCTDTDDLTVTVNPQPTVTVSNDTTICNGDCAQLEATGGVIYQWYPTTDLSDPNISNPLACPSVTTTYNVIVTDSNGCGDTASVTITVNTLPTADAGSDQWLCPGDVAQLNGSGGISCSWSPTTGLSDPNICNPTANPPDSTSYILTVTDINGCSNTDTVVVIVNDEVPTDAGPDPTICEGDTAQIGGSPTAPPGTTYNWVPAGSLDDPNTANPLAFPTVTTQYIVYTTNDTCTNSDTVTVYVTPAPPADAGPDVAYCIGDSIQLNATGGFSYSWNPPDNLDNPNTFNPWVTSDTSITYVVTVGDGTGCFASDTINVTVHPLPVVSAGPDVQICIGDTTQLDATSGFVSYNWLPTDSISDPTAEDPFVWPTDTTDYIVTVIDTNTCINSDTVTVVVNPLPIIDAGIDIQICIGDTAQLIATLGLSTYDWTPVDSISDPNIFDPLAWPVDTTTYMVTVTDTNGCVSSDSLTVIVNPLPIVSAGPDVQVCIGDSAQLNATGGITFDWNPTTGLDDPNIFNPWANPPDTTEYVVSVTDTNGCVNTDSVIVIVNPLPAIDAGTDIQVCIGDTAQLNATTGFVTYDWTPTDSLSDPAIFNPLAWPTDTTIYTVTVSDTNACANSDNVTVIVNPLPNADAGPVVQVCIGDSVQLDGSGGDSYVWTPAGDLDDPNAEDPWASPLDTAWFFVTVTDSNGCMNFDSTEVIVNPLPIVDAGPNLQMCVGDSVQLMASGGVGYSWSPTTGLSDPGIFNPMAGPADTTLYFVTVTDTNSCINIDSAQVDVNPLPTVIMSADQHICLGDTTLVVAVAGGATTYEWFPNYNINDTTTNAPLVWPDTTTLYTVLITDTNGCQNSGDVLIDVFRITSISDTMICEGDSVQLFANGPGATAWNWTPTTGLSDPTAQNPLASPAATTLYTVTVTDSTGCQDMAMVNVDVFTNPTADFEFTIEPNCEGLYAEFTNLSTNADTYLWMFSTGESSDDYEPSHTFPYSTSMTTTLIAINNNGCDDSLTYNMTVDAFDDYFVIEIPNVFTPNGDGINDIFEVVINGNLGECIDMQILNRWGQVLFESTGNNLTWDGYTADGKETPEGTYFYIIGVNELQYKGSLTILRQLKTLRREQFVFSC